MSLITSRHITNWAATRSRDCQDTLPLLVRRLVRATARDLRRLDVPAGDAVSEEGWDGRIDCAAGSPFLPDGTSGWEIGTDASAKGKADKDYTKRVGDPLDLDPARTTFVFVTPRSWPQRHAWAAERRAEGRWRDVRVVAAGELEAWLEEAPPVALWLAAHLDLAPASGFRSLEGWWDTWAAATRPPMTPAMLLGGRAREVEVVRAWLSGPPASLEVQGDTPEEAIAFLNAVAAEVGVAEGEALAARCIVAETEAAFAAAAEWSHPLVIAAPADAAQSAAGAALGRGHHLLLGVGRRLASRGSGPTRLPRIDGHGLSSALVEAGLERGEAARAVVECGRSVPVLRRRRSVLDAVRSPDWADPGNGGVLIPALLAGGWCEKIRPTEGSFGTPNPLLDRDVLRLLGAGLDYDAFASSLHRLCVGDDPPLRRVGSVWRLAAPIDAWFLLSRSVTARDLDRLAEVALAVLPLPDPRYELPDEDRWLANLRGKERPHSGWLREGLAISLAIVAQHGEALGLSPSGGTPAGWAASVVRRALASVRDWQGWSSVSDVLPLLGEAAPDEVLDALDAFLAETEQVQSLLSDGGDRYFGGECRHAGILWTLERLAWHPTHLARCCAILARLDAVDPGGRWGNRPLGSLVDILFWGADPYTYADADGLLAAVDAADAAAPKTGWRLHLAACAPLRSRIVRDPPVFLAARPDGWSSLSRADVRRIAEGLEARLAALVRSADEDRIVAGLECVEQLPPAAQVALGAWLDEAALRPSEGGDGPLWKAVRAALNRNRSFDHDGRHLAVGVEEALRRADIRMRPSDARSRAAWLFRQQPVLSEGETLDWRKDQKRLEALRADVAAELAASLPPEELVSFGAGLEAGWALGVALADVIDAEQDHFVRAMLALARSDSPSVPGLLLVYCDRRRRREGDAWFDRWLAHAIEAPNAPAAVAALFRTLPNDGATWRRVEEFGEETERLYWRWMWPILEDDASVGDRVHALERLLAAERVSDALRLAVERGKAPLPGAALVSLADALLVALTTPDAAQRVNIHWEVEELFLRLDEAGDVPRADFARLEWAFHALLVHGRRGARALHAILAEEPGQFAELISCVYISESERERPASERPELTDAERDRASNASAVLEHWHGPLPGAAEGGLDGGVLRGWVDQARRLCGETGRGAVGDQKIGTLLAYAPADPDDGAWPHRAVREVLDGLRAEHLDTGFTIGIHNARGVTMRNPLDGGEQERELASKYDGWAKTMRGSSPHTARLLRQVAESYRADARREDDRAGLNDLR